MSNPSVWGNVAPSPVVAAIRRKVEQYLRSDGYSPVDFYAMSGQGDQIRRSGGSLVAFGKGHPFRQEPVLIDDGGTVGQLKISIRDSEGENRELHGFLLGQMESEFGGEVREGTFGASSQPGTRVYTFMRAEYVPPDGKICFPDE